MDHIRHEQWTTYAMNSVNGLNTSFHFAALILILLLLFRLIHLLCSLRSLHLSRSEGRLVRGGRVVNLRDLRAAGELVLDCGGRRGTVVGCGVLLTPADVDVLKLPACIRVESLVTRNYTNDII